MCFQWNESVISLKLLFAIKIINMFTIRLQTLNSCCPDCPASGSGQLERWCWHVPTLQSHPLEGLPSQQHHGMVDSGLSLQLFGGCAQCGQQQKLPESLGLCTDLFRRMEGCWGAGAAFFRLSWCKSLGES